MPRQLKVNTVLTPDDLAKIAKKEPNPRVRQRLLAVRLVVMGNTVPQAAKAIGLKQRQSRNWIHRFNDEGVNGLRDRPRSGQPVKLHRQEEQAFRERIEKGATQEDPTRNLRVKDIQRILREEFGADYCLGGTYFLLHRLGFSSLVPRPHHPKADQQAQTKFKKNVANMVSKDTTATSR
jgi:transposase